MQTVDRASLLGLCGFAQGPPARAQANDRVAHLAAVDSLPETSASSASEGLSSSAPAAPTGALEPCSELSAAGARNCNAEHRWHDPSAAWDTEDDRSA